jgi:hypothetical protein
MLGVLCNCSREVKFSERIAQADRVVVTKPGQDGTPASLAVSGADAQGIVKAVASAQQSGDVPPDANALKIEFFKGTNLLGALLTSEGCFWPQTPGRDYLVEYWDGTGTLTNFVRSSSEKWHRP